jgi:raffinose/stachyose/melibiose transport system substrate-binding protein
MTKRLVVLLSVFLLLTAAFVGGSRAATDKKVKISIFDMFNTPDADANSKAFDALKKKFKRDFPNVVIKEEAVAHDEYETKMKTYAAANELPDTFELKGTMIPGLVDNRQIVAIEKIIHMVPGWEKGYKSGVFGDFEYNDKYYAFPFQMGNNHNIYWNAAIFKKCGIKGFPTTWKQFLAAIKTLKAKGYIPIAMGNKGKWVAPSLIFNTIAYRYVSVDWYNSLKKNTGAKFTDPDFVAATKCMQDLAKMGAFNPDMNSIDNFQQRTLYYNKKAAMFIEGFWAVTPLIDEAPKDVLKATRIAQFPAIPGGKGDGRVNQAAAGWGWAVNSKVGDDKKQAVADFLNYVTGSEYANVVVENFGLPASKPSRMAKNLPPLYRELLKLNEECVYAPVFDVQLPPQVVDAFYSNLQEVLIGTMTPETYCKLLQKEMDATR